MDSSGVPLRGIDHAVLHDAAGQLHYLPDRAAGLLGEHCAARGCLVLQLDVRDWHGPGERRHAAADVYRDQAAHCDRAGAVCVRGAAVGDQHLCKHRVHRGRAA